MAGTILAAMRSSSDEAEQLAFVQRFFDTPDLPAPAAPAEVTWLETIDLAPPRGPQTETSSHPPVDVALLQIARREIETTAMRARASLDAFARQADSTATGKCNQ